MKEQVWAYFEVFGLEPDETSEYLWERAWVNKHYTSIFGK